MLTRTVRKFLTQPRVARLATLGRDGYPHIVPIYFMLDGDDIIFGSDDDERKVVNARRRPKGAVVIGGEPDADDAGYLIQGDLRVEKSASRALMRKMLRRYESAKEAREFEAEWTEGKLVLIRLKPRKVIRVW